MYLFGYKRCIDLLRIGIKIFFLFRPRIKIIFCHVYLTTEFMLQQTA